MKKRIFADTSYWIANLNEDDQWFEAVENVSRSLGDVEIVTTETVLIEVLNYFSGFGEKMKGFVADSVENILNDDGVLVLLHKHKSFLQALELYKSRLDKGYSLTDCISMNAMREFGIPEILTNDAHFQQEGFTKLF